MPFSTLSAVRTPGSDRPSSTSVIATAGRIPTTTVSASSTRDMAAMLASIRPMNESTISSEEMSIRTPRAWSETIRFGEVVLQPHREAVVHVDLNRDQQQIAHLQDRDPLGLGHRSRPITVDDRSAAPSSATAIASAIVALVVTSEGQPEMDDRLRDLRTDAADDAVGAHQTGGRDGLEQVLGDERVDGRHAGDVDDRHLEFVSTIRSSRLSITICVRSLSRVPISGTATTPSHSLTTGVDSSISSCCWRAITASRPF